jgi:hypothetical protein
MQKGESLRAVADGRIMDVRPRDTMAIPLATALRSRRTSFVFFRNLQRKLAGNIIDIDRLRAKVVRIEEARQLDRC